MPRPPISIPDLRRALDRRTLRRADIDHALYVAPVGSTGVHTVEFPVGSGTHITAGSALQGQTFRPGTLVPLGSHVGDPRKSILGGPPSGQRGASAFPADTGTPGSLSSIGIISAAPTTIEAGATSEPVVLTGFGFLSSHTFEAVRMGASGWEADPLITVATTSVPDSETANITLTVSSSAPVGHPISIRIVSTSHVGADLMSVIEQPAYEIADILVFSRANSGDPLECWEADEDGNPMSFYATVTVDDQENPPGSSFSEPGRRMVRASSVIYDDPLIATPALAWFTSMTQSTGVAIKGYVWSPTTGDLYTWSTTPRNPGSRHDASAPFQRPGSNDGYVYWLQCDQFSGPSFKHSLWRVKMDASSSPAMLGELLGVPASGPVNPTIGDSFGVGGSSIWFDYDGNFTFPSASGFPSGMQKSPLPYAGEAAGVPYAVGLRVSGSPAGVKRRIAFDIGAKSATSVTAWASGSATSSYVGDDCMTSVNRVLDTDGVFPYDGHTPAGAYIKLSQPLGTNASEGNSTEEPRIFIAPRGTSLPHIVHLAGYAYPWSIS